MNALDPKEQFLQSRKEAADLLAQVAGEPWFTTAIVYAYAEYAVKAPSKEALAGARDFADILVQLGTRPETQETYPPKSLKVLDKNEPIVVPSKKTSKK